MCIFMNNDVRCDSSLYPPQVTWADLAYYAFFYDFLEVQFGGAFLKEAPLLKSLLLRVKGLPNIKKWIEFRTSKYYSI